MYPLAESGAEVGWGKRRLADEELRMLHSHSGWKRSELIITKTAARAWVQKL
jgi:hypothetical protein